MDRVSQLKSIQTEALELFTRKNADYKDAFAKYGVVGVFMRMEDKLQRFMNISNTKVELVGDEGIRDTLLDLHNYAAMAMMLLESSPRVIFIDKTPLVSTHEFVKNSAIGASEYQFYNLIAELSKKRSITCYNLVDKVIGNVTYKPLSDIENDVFYPSDIIIVQRFCLSIPEKLKKQRVFVWIHDYGCEATTKSGDFDKIEFIFNSEFTREIYMNYFQSISQKPKHRVIYNMLYKEEFDVSVCQKENKIVYASAWCKGIDHIIKLFRSLIKLDNEIRLELLSPGYDYQSFLSYKMILEHEFKDRITIRGPLNKQEYCKILKSSICVLTPRYPETFGCVFAESYYLGVPVIADIYSGAVKEIIDNNFIVNYDYPEQVYEKIQQLKTPQNFSLDEKFLTSIDKWEELVSS